MSVETDEIVAGVADVLHGEQRGRLARGERERGDAAFERGDALLEHRLGRVHDAGVDVAELLEREQVGRVLGRIELIGGGLIDRHRDRGGGRIGAIAGMQNDGFRILALGRHVFSLWITAKTGSPPRREYLFQCDCGTAALNASPAASFY